MLDITWLLSYAPELMVVMGIFIVLGIGLVRGKVNDKAMLVCLAIIAAAVLVFWASVPKIIANGFYVLDSFASCAKLGVVLIVMVVVMITGEQVRPRELLKFEYNILLLFVILGAFVLVSAHDLLTLFVGLELQALALYVLTGMCRDNTVSTEAALKYFVLGALSSGIFLYGCSLIYGYTGTTNFALLRSIFHHYDIMPIIPIIGLVFIISAMAFKVALVPFHMWLPDVYQGTPSAMTVFLATVPKYAAVWAIIRLLMQPFGDFFIQWQMILGGLVAVSMVTGAVGALMQQNLRRLLAYSSITHMGFALMGIIPADEMSLIAVLVYMIIYVVMILGIFATLLQLHHRGHGIEVLADLEGLAYRQPKMAFALAVLLFSMAGIPPLAGFWTKFYILHSMVTAGWYGLAVTAVLASVVAAFYYLRIIKVMYFEEESKTHESIELTSSILNTGVMIAAAGVSAGFVFMVGNNTGWLVPIVRGILGGW